MSESARAPLQTGQTITRIESSPLNPAGWETLAQKARSENDPLSIKSLEVIIEGLKKLEAKQEETKQPPVNLSGVSQSMFVRLARAYNSPTLLKEVGLVYLRDLRLPEVALRHFERALLLGGPEKELRPLTEAAAVATQRQLTLKEGGSPELSGLTSVRPASPLATTIIRRTGKMLLPPTALKTGSIPAAPPASETNSLNERLPETTPECLSQAQAALAKGSLRRVEALLRKANEKPGLSHEMWQAWTSLGQAEYERGNHAKVEAAFSEALRFEPTELASHFNAALGFQLNKKFEEAVEAYTKADELQKDHPKVWCNLGALYFQVDEYALAEQALQVAVEADPTYVRAWDNLAAALGAQDKLDDAFEACKKAVELRPGCAEAHFKMGIILFSRNEMEKAISEFRRASVMEALAGDCEALLAMAFARLQQTESAEAAVRRAMQIAPECDLLWMAWNDLGLAWSIEKNYARSAAAYGEATLIKPSEPATWFNLGASYHRAGELNEARDAYQHAVDLDESRPDAWHNLGTVCAETGDLRSAANAFQREIGCAPENLRAWYDLGVTFEKTGEHEFAKAAFARAEELERSVSTPAPKGPATGEAVS